MSGSASSATRLSDNGADVRRPNIILIVADDMGYGDCGCFGSETIRTPNIDAIAERGIRFTDFHSNGAVCSPTRAALLTGRYQQRTGIEGVITAKNHRHVGLPLEETTFADLLGADGYATALFGKWHLGYEERFNPTRRGFDEFVGFVSGNIDYKSHIDQVGIEDWWRSDKLTPEDGYTTDLVTEHGVRFIEENKDKPFCLYLAHECPHYPYQGPNDEAYRTPGNAKPINGPREDKAQAYKEMMECMDAGIGRIVDTVAACGLEEDTLVFFFSDNGPSGPGSAGVLRGGKGNLWEGGHRVPAAACWTGTIPPGTETHTPCIGMDLFPTMLAMAGAQAPADLTLDGVDIMPVMTGQAPKLERDLFWRFKNKRAIRSGKWKLVLGEGDAETRELFDLENDLPESNNVIAEHQDLARELEEEIAAWEMEVSAEEKLS
jgi:arylsulfatase A-like enzyme